MNNENIEVINIDNKEIIIVGTAHVSEVSANLVEEAIRFYMPDCVCIELDDQRLESLVNPKKWDETNIKDVIKNKQTLQMLASLILSSYQQRMASQLDTQVGLEMLRAISVSKELNIPLATIDRNVKITFSRIWHSLSLREKADLIGLGFQSLFESDENIEEDDLQSLLEEDTLSAALAEVRKEIPTVARILVDERDQYLAHKIKHAKGQKVLAVVGGAHVPGIKQELFKEQNIKEINTVPPKSPVFKYVNIGLIVLLLTVLILPFINGFDSGLSAVLKWSLFSSSGAAIACLLIGAHPLTVLAAFASAPIAAIHPLLAVGFVAALVEASLRKPTVHDFNRINEDIKSYIGWRSNRVIKILALVIIANLGSVIGQLISGLSIISSLFK